MFLIRAAPNWESVIIPAWPPVSAIALMPNFCRVAAITQEEMISPQHIIISISRTLTERLTSFSAPISVSVA